MANDIAVELEDVLQWGRFGHESLRASPRSTYCGHGAKGDVFFTPVLKAYAHLKQFTNSLSDYSQAIEIARQAKPDDEYGLKEMLHAVRKALETR